MLAKFPAGRIAVLTCVLLCGVVVATGPASAHGTLGTASAAAETGLQGCTGAGKALYDCVAGVLDRMGAEIASFPQNEKQTAAALRSAARSLRAAVNQAQALSAIALCQAAIASAVQQARVISVNNSLYRG